MKAANHLAMYVPMKQSCMICTCTPEPKEPKKKKIMQYQKTKYSALRLALQSDLKYILNFYLHLLTKYKVILDYK